jgi:hypothetical protein
MQCYVKVQTVQAGGWHCGTSTDTAVLLPVLMLQLPLLRDGDWLMFPWFGSYTISCAT